jgi:precorrin-6Y C5,15-methyltransferase (decarboxylating)
VINAIALESMGEIADIIAKYGFDDAEVVQMSLARSRKAGRYHLMAALNPITIAAMQRQEDAHED